VSAGSFPAGAPPIVHHVAQEGQEGLCLSGCGASSGSSMTTDPCEVQITIRKSASAGSAEKWGSVSERANGCAATVTAIASSRNVRNATHNLRMRYASDVPLRKAIAATSQLAKNRPRL
jgi:hypothetical protein